MDYDEYVNEKIRKMGFNPNKLNEDQKYVLLEPSEAPENYYQDGEVTPDQAKQHWRKHMKKQGFSSKEIANAEKHLGI